MVPIYCPFRFLLVISFLVIVSLLLLWVTMLFGYLSNTSWKRKEIDKIEKMGRRVEDFFKKNYIILV